jgi:hypothetical protein
MEDLLNFVQVWARAMKGRDSLGHFIGAWAIGNEQALLQAVDAYVNHSLNPNAKRPTTKRPPVRLPKLPSVKVPPNVTSRLPKVELPKLPKVELPKKLQDIPKVLGDTLGDITGHGPRAAGPQPKSSGSDALRLFDYLFGS